MSFNKSSLAFDDIQGAFDRALAAPKGVRIKCSSRGEAIVLRTRFNYFRKLNRKENKEVYTSDQPMWGKSAYDKLVLRVPPKGAEEDNTLFIEPRSVEDLDIEDIK